jgi:hypothetical protein
MLGEQIKMNHKKKNSNTSFPYNKPAIRLAYNLLYLVCSRDYSHSNKLNRGVIQAVFSLIDLIHESTKKSIFQDPVKFLNKLYSTTAVLYGQIKVFRESGYLSESDFIDLLDKITAMKYEFNAFLLNRYKSSSADDEPGPYKNVQSRQPI